MVGKGLGGMGVGRWEVGGGGGGARTLGRSSTRRSVTFHQSMQLLTDYILLLFLDISSLG